MLPTLAHVLACHVKASFESVEEAIAEVIDKETFDDSNSQKVEELALYFKNTYVEGIHSHEKGTFPNKIMEPVRGRWRRSGKDN